MTPPNPTFERDFAHITSLDLDPPDYELLADSRVKKLMQLAWIYGSTNAARDATEMIQMATDDESAPEPVSLNEASIQAFNNFLRARIPDDYVLRDSDDLCDLCSQPCDEPGNIHQACATRENAETR